LSDLFSFRSTSVLLSYTFKRSKRLTFLSVLVCTLVTSSNSVESNATLWDKFEALRQGSRALHQEFEVKAHVGSGYVEHQSRYQLKLDISQGKWREQSVGQSGDLTRIFDGQDLFLTEPGGTEYARGKEYVHQGKGDRDAPLPAPYENRLDWSKAKELQRLPCGFAGKDHTCVVIDAPIKPWVRPAEPGQGVKMTLGTIRVMIDTETGIWLRCRIMATVEGSMGGSGWDIQYSATDMTYGGAADESLFKLPGNLHEVDYLTSWNDARIKKELAGKPAPDLQMKDLQGNPVSLADLKGKTVLLDFWTTWCPPCQSDASSLDKLNQKYGNKGLAIIGISVSEDREIVEKYLKKHPHNFPVALSSENMMPRPYQIHVLPTYFIIGTDGTLVTAEEGDKGFAKLRKDLEKAGMQTE
jgi:thiol-disulfide isomerase/thioredoxin